MIAKKVLITSEKLLQTFSPIHQNIKNRKTKKTRFHRHGLLLLPTTDQPEFQTFLRLAYSTHADKSMRVEGIGLKFVTTDFLG